MKRYGDEERHLRLCDSMFKMQSAGIPGGIQYWIDNILKHLPCSCRWRKGHYGRRIALPIRTSAPQGDTASPVLRSCLRSISLRNEGSNRPVLAPGYRNSIRDTRCPSSRSHLEGTRRFGIGTTIFLRA